MVKEKLSNLYDIGSSKRVFQSEWRKTGVPFYRAREIARLSEEGYVDNELFIDKELYEEYTEKYGKPQPGDVMVTGVGTLGVCYVVKPEDEFYFKDGNILWFKQKEPERILPEYLVKAFDSKEVKDFISKNSSGTTVGTFTIQTANKMEISLPTLDQQKEIIERLSKLEGIIKKRQHEIEMFDELIKARFVEMFGDVRINPKGWDICRFEEISDLITDGEHATPRRTDKGIYLLSARNVLNHTIQLDDVDYIDKDEYDRISKRLVPQEGDVLISCSGSVGRCCSVPAGLKFQMVRSAALIRFKSVIVPKFAEYMITSDYVQEQIESSKTASSQANLFQGKIAKLRGFVPPLEMQNEFVSFVKQVDKSKVAVQKALDETKLLFDSLMQEYFG